MCKNILVMWIALKIFSAEQTQMYKNLSTQCAFTCASVTVCEWHMYSCTHTWTLVSNDKAETRDALQLLIPSDEAESSSDTIHLPCLNPNLPRCGMSNSLGTNGICQPTSKCFFYFFLCHNKGVQRFTQSSSKRSPMLSLVCMLPLLGFLPRVLKYFSLR